MNGILAYLRELNMASMMLRILLAMFIGGFVGFEREKKRRPAGFRTYMLVALGAALTVILSQYLDYMLSNQWAETAKEIGIKTDVSRFGAQVINGVGFLGAGTIIVTGRLEVKGLTTAAGLWASACIGLAVGAGFYECVAVSFLLIVLSMKLLPFVEDVILASSRHLNIYVELDNFDNLGALIGKIKNDGLGVYDVDFHREKQEGMAKVNALISLSLPARTHHTEILASLSKMPGIVSIEEV